MVNASRALFYGCLQRTAVLRWIGRFLSLIIVDGRTEAADPRWRAVAHPASYAPLMRGMGKTAFAISP